MNPTNYQLQELLTELKTVQNPFWKRIAHDLMKPSRQRCVVNMYKINKFARDGELIVVPGKVLSVGEIKKQVEVAAVNFSDEARKKIILAKGRTLTMRELLKENPEGKKVRILG